MHVCAPCWSKSVCSEVSAKIHAAHLAVGAGVAGIGVVLGWGASRFPVEKGYAILGPQVYPYAVAAFLGLLGFSMCFQALTGGFRKLANDPADRARVPRQGRRGAAWVSTGLVCIALLIVHVGFVIAAALLFACSARGFGSNTPARDLALGIAIALPVYWLFTAGLGVSLPALVGAWI